MPQLYQVVIQTIRPNANVVYWGNAFPDKLQSLLNKLNEHGLQHFDIDYVSDVEVLQFCFYESEGKYLELESLKQNWIETKEREAYYIANNISQTVISAGYIET